MAIDESPRSPEPAAEVGEEKTQGEENEQERSFLREVPVLVLIALVVAILIKTFLVQAFFIPSSSMEQTLVPGDRVLVNKLAYRVGDIHEGDVIVFKNPDEGAIPHRGVIGGFIHWFGEGLGFSQPPNEDLIKRVIGLPGDTVQIKNHTVFVNDEPLSEPYLTAAAKASMNPYGPVTVPTGELFVLGDNRGDSADSRIIGFIPEKNVVGRAFVIIWPPGNWGGLG